MTLVSNRNVQIEFSGAVQSSVVQSALENAVSVGNQIITDLASGDNTITIPVVTDGICTGVTIILPSANTVLVILKGDAADVGVALNLVDPSSFGIDTTVTEIILNAADDLPGVIIIFS